MKRSSLALVFALFLLSLAIERAAPAVAVESDQHAYFNSLVARGDHWRSYSLRDPVQLGRRAGGGYANSNSGPLHITYDPASDTNVDRQDAAKVIIPAFRKETTLAAPASSSDVVISLVSGGGGTIGFYYAGRAILVDNEIMTVVSRSANLITVTRGTRGTTAAAHAAGADVKVSANSLQNQVRLPLETTDGHSYLFTWDGYWTRSYVGSNLTNHKTFQFSTGGDAVWLEVRTRFDGGSKCCETPGMFSPQAHLAAIDMRSYQTVGGDANWALTDSNKLGPGVTGVEPVQPKMGSFVLSPNKWTRFWVRIDQRANNYDYMDFWMADETTGPVQIYKGLALSVRNTKGIPNSIERFWLEYGTSTEAYVRGDLRDLVSYVRNFVALRDVADVSKLLLRPVPGMAVQAGPAPPTGVRILN